MFFFLIYRNHHSLSSSFLFFFFFFFCGGPLRSQDHSLPPPHLQSCRSIERKPTSRFSFMKIANCPPTCSKMEASLSLPASTRLAGKVFGPVHSVVPTHPSHSAVIPCPDEPVWSYWLVRWKGAKHGEGLGAAGGGVGGVGGRRRWCREIDELGL